MTQLPIGIYEALLDSKIKNLLTEHPGIRYLLGKIEPEEEPSQYARFIAKIAEQALKTQESPQERRRLVNQVLTYLSQNQKCEHLKEHTLPEENVQLLLEVTPTQFNTKNFQRPETPITESTLFTGAPADPQLAHELAKEMCSADSVDILVSFIKWSGLRLLMPALEDLKNRGVPVRVVTTSYMGASDSPAVDYLHSLPNVEVRVSYDTERTRLHAKAYYFKRYSGFSSAYIGSANMSHPAMTSGLEWNLKVTEPDMQTILEKFAVEFESYWHSGNFIPYEKEGFQKAIQYARKHTHAGRLTLFDLKPHPFQERILDALTVEREVRGEKKNLVVAATGTGKTVVSAFDFKRFYEKGHKRPRLLFVAHRIEILLQAQQTFQAVLKNQNFGMIHGGSHVAESFDNLFCTVQSFNAQRLWERLPPSFFQFIIIDEVHHGAAQSYRQLFNHFTPEVLLGLTATPERMDGEQIVADFGNRFAAEIRLPEALEEKLLCPFQYFGVHDGIDISDDSFWQQGRYSTQALESVYVLDSHKAQQRVNVIISEIRKYEPDKDLIKGIGFCVSKRHAEFMAKAFNSEGYPSETYISDGTNNLDQLKRSALEKGTLSFLFTVDRLSEGIDIASINMVLFLRPTDSLTVFLQQLGRGLRHAPGKECLTVLDFVGQVHRHYRLDTKFKALLPKHRYTIDKEVDLDFPHLPAGCSIQLERIAKEKVLKNIRYTLLNLKVLVPELLKTFQIEKNLQPTFGNFIQQTDIDPEELLHKQTWSEWKGKALQHGMIDAPDIIRLRPALSRAVWLSGPNEIQHMSQVVTALLLGDIQEALRVAADQALTIHYRMWGKTGPELGIDNIRASFEKIAANRSILLDLEEILAWRACVTPVAGVRPKVPGIQNLELHGLYRRQDILVASGRATLEKLLSNREGVLYLPHEKTYVFFVTFQKTEKDFSPRTMYADYPISRELMHWESQSTTSLLSETGQRIIKHREQGVSIVIFARDKKTTKRNTIPYTYLGPATLASHESERPIKIVWQLHYPMPVEMFEDNRRGG